jgi:uncharacterized coiled-coil protein SlyX
MLFNEFLKTYRKVDQQGRKVQDQQAIIADLKSTLVQQEKGIKLLTARLEEQDSKIRKMSDQLLTSSPSGALEAKDCVPQVARNNQ